MEFWLADLDQQRKCEVIIQTGASFRFAIRDIERDDRGGEPTAEKPPALAGLCRRIMNGRSGAASSSVKNKGGAAGRASGAAESPPSYIIVPLSSGDQTIGLLQLKDRRADFFSESDLDFYENFAPTLGNALLNQRAQAALRERVKELTCMYAIEQAAGAGVSIDEIMRSAAALLPPAWQFPHLARGRIVLDGRAFTAPGFQEGPHRLSAALLVHGEPRGEVEVFYTEAAFVFDEGPFLREERNLIDNIAKALALIIEQKQAEEEKARLKDQIRHADRLATIGQLAAGVAHELNEPLGAILGFAQLMEKNPPAPGQMKQDAERIVKASLHAREIVKKLLIFARQVPIRKVKVDMNQVVTDGLYFLESRCAQDGITVVRRLGPGLPGVIADPAQMTQVLVNLTVNAVQAMKTGGTLTVRTTADGDHISLVIEDTGEGMSEAVMKRIFLPFFTTKAIGQGTGLGLAVVHGIVTSHGGTITVASEPGHGSRFEIRLPCAAVTASE